MRRCLIVDDSSVVRKIARIILEGMGYEVAEAENGKEALESCKANPPDAILLDWQMPVMGALEFLTGLRIHTSGKRPYIVYLTTENDFADISRAYTAGADAFLLKPFDRAALEEKFLPGNLAA